LPGLITHIPEFKLLPFNRQSRGFEAGADEVISCFILVNSCEILVKTSEFSSELVP
jgi:hypothetical protein